MTQRNSTTSSTVSCEAFQNSNAGGDADKVVLGKTTSISPKLDDDANIKVVKRWSKKSKEYFLLSEARGTYYGGGLHSSSGRRLSPRSHPTPTEMKTPVKFIPSSKKSTNKSKPMGIAEEGSRVTDVGTVGEAMTYKTNLKINPAYSKFEASNHGAPPAEQKKSVEAERANDAVHSRRDTAENQSATGKCENCCADRE